MELPAQRFVKSVQGLRGVSALSVLCVHIYLMALHGGFFPIVSAPVVNGVSTLGQGVLLFFIISGFVVPASLVRHKDLSRFLIDRVLRIMPVFLIIHVFVFAIGPFIGYKWMGGLGAVSYLESFIANMTFIALPLGLPLAQQNSWTLTYEWLFYLSLSLGWYVTARHRGSWISLACVGLAGFLVCLCFERCFYFVLGMAFAFSRIQVRLGKTAEMFVAPVAVFVFYYCAQFIGLVYALPAGFLLFSLVLQEDGLTSRLLCQAVLQKMGLISYSLYLVHPLTTFPYQILGRLLVRHGVRPALIFPVFALAAVATAVAVALLTYEWIEVRLRNTIAYRIGRRHGVVSMVDVPGTSV